LAGRDTILLLYLELSGKSGKRESKKKTAWWWGGIIGGTRTGRENVSRLVRGTLLRGSKRENKKYWEKEKCPEGMHDGDQGGREESVAKCAKNPQKLVG